MDTTENPHAGQGMVVLDIGGDIGALVVSTPPTMAGLEIEICPAGRRDHQPDEGTGWWSGEWRQHHENHAGEHRHDHEHGHEHGHEHHAHGHGPAWPHVAVLSRPVPSGSAHAAVYPGLQAGRFELWVRPAEPTALVVEVVGGEVTTAVWPT
jgi:hypothetical protein